MTTEQLMQLTETHLADLRHLHGNGASVEQMVEHLAKSGVPKGAAMIALRRSGVMSLRDAKQAVHQSPSFDYRRASDELFHQSALDAMDQLQEADRATAA